MDNNIKFCRCCNLPKGIICKKCGEEKTSDEYDPGKKMCKDCRREYNKTYYLKRKQKKDEYDADIEIIKNDNIVGDPYGHNCEICKSNKPCPYGHNCERCKPNKPCPCHCIHCAPLEGICDNHD